MSSSNVTVTYNVTLDADKASFAEASAHSQGKSLSNLLQEYVDSLIEPEVIDNNLIFHTPEETRAYFGQRIEEAKIQ